MKAVSVDEERTEVLEGILKEKETVVRGAKNEILEIEDELEGRKEMAAELERPETRIRKLVCPRERRNPW